MNLEPLKPLAFGNHSPQILTTLEEINSFISKGTTVAEGVRAPTFDLRYRGSHLFLPKLKVFASSSDPFQIDTVAPENEVAITLPLNGFGHIRDGRRLIEWNSPNNVIYQAYGGEQNFSFEARRSVLFFMVEADRLNMTVQSMFGKDLEGLERIVPNHPIVAQLSVAEQNVRSVLLSTLSLVDLPDNSQEHLIRIGFDDVIHRLLAEMTFLRFRGQSEPAPAATFKRSTKALDIVCDYIKSNADKVLTCTEMEQMTGMTSRSLSNAFNERFNCSPQEWQRNVHLDYARTEMLNPNNTSSVKAISYQFGFVSPSSFTKFYQRRFGELPNETKKKSCDGFKHVG